MIWLKMLFQKLGLKEEEYIVYCDSQSTIDLRKNDTYYVHTKHVDVRHHWIREAINKNLTKLEKTHINKDPSDMMTKIMYKGKLKLCSELVIGLNLNSMQGGSWRLPYDLKGEIVGQWSRPSGFKVMSILVLVLELYWGLRKGLFFFFFGKKSVDYIYGCNM